jgi:hypothetical protein
MVVEGFFYSSPKSARDLFNQNWLWTQQIIEDSKKEITSDTLYVGCSVAAQIFPYNRGNQLTSTANTYAIGNYFLIKNAVERNPHLRTVILLSVPDMLGLKIANEKTYSYFVKPFYTFQNRGEINSSKAVQRVLSKNPMLFLCVLNSYKVISSDDFNYFDGENPPLGCISEESLEWISKIKKLCDDYRVNFILASPPVLASKKIISSDWRNMRKRVSNTPLCQLFEKYFRTIIYVDDSFSYDGLHWKADFISAHRTEFVATLKERLKSLYHN